MEFITKTPSQTKKLGEILAKEILKSNFKNSVILALKGDLGGGKTTFLQGFAKGLGIKEKILSPTFIILKKFQIPNSKYKYFYHFDCYRIEKSKEVLKLGFKKLISNPKNIVAIEWADKIRKIVPKNSLKIDFKFINKNNRKINVSLKKI
jgi:tRNA threonylcarbamoyladenosine biosynthesis protein TsaE